jgi:hypothetical protein
MACETVIDLRHPVRSEKRRGFQPPWYTVYVYQCPTCGREHRLRAQCFRGFKRTPAGHLVPINPEPGVGAIRCGGP